MLHKPRAGETRKQEKIVGMDAQNPQPFEIIEAHYPSSKETHNPSFASGKWCCVISSLLLSLAIFTAAILIIVFVLKPKKPIFHLHAIQLGSFKLDATSSKEGNASSSVLSLLFVTQNPNKFGIRYSSSVLGIFFESNPIGIIEVPTFYQPSHSRNETVLMHVLFKQLNISRLIGGELMNSSSDGYHIEIRVTGGILAQPHVLNFSLPKIKLSLDCRISINYGAFALSRGFSSLKSDKVLFISNFPHLSQKCSLALCI